MFLTFPVFSELEVKVITLNDITKIKKLKGHRKGVRRATWHPSGTILARSYYSISWKFSHISSQTTCGSDGHIIVWDVTLDEEPRLLEIIEGVIPSVDPEYVMKSKLLLIVHSIALLALRTTLMIALQCGTPLESISL